jgi:hypothetical protein
MHVCLDGTCHLVVDDKTDILDINTTSSKVRGNEDVGVAGT